MDPDFAIVLDNWFPRTADVQMRRGADDWVTGFAAPVESFLPYNGATTQQLFAASGVGIYDVTAAGAVGAAVKAITNDRLISVNFRTAGVSGLYAVNGTDLALYYDGAAWVSVNNVSVPAITGVVTSTLKYVSLHKRRLWFVQKNTMSLWYLPVDVIAGAAVEFPVGQIFVRGGSITATGTLSFDGGDGPDDYFIIVTSEGEVAFYQGTDPNTAATWALVGVYFVGKPLGARCLSKFGGDLLYLSTNGLAPLTKLLQSATINRQTQFSYNIENAFLASAQAASTLFGWEACVFPAQAAILVNVPTATTGIRNQYVMNSQTGAWCRFLDWNPLCFTVFNEELYFGGTTKVAKAWTGLDDFGQNIAAYAKTAYNYFGTRGRLKKWNLVRPVMVADNSLSIGIGVSVDFEDNVDFSVISSFGLAAATWDISLWDIGLWAVGPGVTQNWRFAAAKPGMCAAFRLYINSMGVDLTWISNDYVFELGGVL
jgi:hypothetical protein